MPSTNVHMKVIHWYYNSRENRKYLSTNRETKYLLTNVWFTGTITVERQKIPSTNVWFTGTITVERQKIPSTNWFTGTITVEKQKNTFYQRMKGFTGTITVERQKNSLQHNEGKWFTGTITVETENNSSHQIRETENTFYQCMKVVHWYYNSRERQKIPSTQCMKKWFTGTITVERQKMPLPMYESGLVNSRETEMPLPMYESGSLDYNSRETENTSTNV
ncbi:unnamed protein product [Mytilus edulis]|uniref:Uncharacterized protein n=1 Tax=Mytilus edulis TaxID=6550 RepID=A0A8S3Q8P3_MYTED|nr:unnamed protein product [Mytilus edulis]